jgi:hypothetical protein
LSDRGEEWSECCVGHRGLNAHISTHITAYTPRVSLATLAAGTARVACVGHAAVSRCNAAL